MYAGYLSHRRLGGRVVACICGFMMCGLAPGQSIPAPKPNESFVLRAARILDIGTGAYLKDAAVYVEGERIKAVGPAADVLKHAPEDVRVIDLGDATVLPGLID